MSKGALLSIRGLYLADPTLFDNMVLPEEMDRATVIDAILQDCMELETVYPSTYAMKLMIGVWSRREQKTFERIYQAEQAEYNPIENYDRRQTDTRDTQHSGNDVTNGTASETINNSNLHKYAAFDSGSLADQTQDNQTGSGSQSVQNTLTHGERIGDTFTSYIHGNIGVTTSQQMLQSELELAPKINTINYVVNSFKMRFCILVY